MATILTPPELLERVKAEQARRSLREFVRQAWPVVEPATTFMPNWHIDAICDHLEAVTGGAIRNLLINMPPRCMKSTIVSVMWPCWVWTHTPGAQWLFSSYALALAIRDSVKCRRLIESPWYQRAYGDVFQMAADQNLKSRFENTQTGYRYATSVNSGVTGEGGEYICCDDPHNVREAESAAVREATLEWWDQAMSTRLNDPKTGRKVIVMQRVHANDLSGHVLAQGGYEHLNLPMEYEPDRRCVTSVGWSDPRQDDGDFLWPARFGAGEVSQLKTNLGPYGYAGQCQQRPTPKAGGTFKREWLSQRYRELPALQSIIQTVDSAFKEGVASDFSVIATWGANTANYYLLHIWRGRVAFPELITAIQDQYARFHPREVLIEDKASGQSAIQVLRRTTRLPIIPAPVATSKETRADAVSPLFEAGKVWLPETADWLDAWIDEHVNFPRAAHDDQVDTTSMALARLHTGQTAADMLAHLEARADLRAQWQTPLRDR